MVGEQLQEVWLHAGVCHKQVSSCLELLGAHWAVAGCGGLFAAARLVVCTHVVWRPELKFACLCRVLVAAGV